MVIIIKIDKQHDKCRQHQPPANQLPDKIGVFLIKINIRSLSVMVFKL